MVSCEDKNCIFKYKSYGASGTGIKPHQCKLSVHIASYIFNEYNCTTCELGCNEANIRPNDQLKAVRVIQQMVWEGHNGKL